MNGQKNDVNNTKEMKHKWFQGFDWEALVNRQLAAPIVPSVSGDADTSNFDPYPDSLEEAPMP